MVEYSGAKHQCVQFVIKNLNLLKGNMMNNKLTSNKLAKTLLVTAMVMPFQVNAEVVGNVALTTDYVWRGITQALEDPAIQGGFDYAAENGIYLGVWGSNVDFGGAESLELDIYGGWAKEFENGIGIDFGFIEYTYHGGSGAGDSDFTEYYAGASYAGFGVTYYVGDEFDDNLEVSYGYDFDKVSLGVVYGDYDTYNYYSASISTEYAGLGFDLTFHDNDIDALGDSAVEDLLDSRLVFTISKEL